MTGQQGQQELSDQKYTYWLAAQGLAGRALRQLFAVYQSAQEIYGQNSGQLEKVPGLLEEDVQCLIKNKQSWDLDAEWQRLAQRGISFTSREDAHYPAQFRELTQAPYGVFYRGKLPEPGEFRVAIVGARMCSEYGRSIAREVAKELAKHDVPIVSGMARGIDAAGHRGALDGGGDTYAVFGCGVDVCYPAYHGQLYADIAGHGGILSEYPPGTAPFAYHFPQRNRLISALSDVVLVVEARVKSGSLITADYALEQGRDVYALPGRITDSLSGGCNQLIAQGAGVLLSVEDFLENLSVEAVRKKASGRKKQAKKRKSEKIPLEKAELLVYSCLGLLPVGMEEILFKTGLDMRTAAQVLTALQQKKQVEEIYKNHYKILTE